MNYKVGQKVKIIANYTSHGWHNGAIVTLTGASNNGNNRWMATDGVRSYTLDARDMEPYCISIKSLENRQKELNEEIQEIRDKIKYMKENNIEELDEEEYRIVKRVYNLCIIVFKPLVDSLNLKESNEL